MSEKTSKEGFFFSFNTADIGGFGYTRTSEWDKPKSPDKIHPAEPKPKTKKSRKE